MGTLRRILRWSVGVISVLALVLGLRIGAVLVAERIGVHEHAQGRTQSAAAWFRQGTVLNPSDPWLSWYDLGVARYDGGDLEGAETAYRHALELAPEEQRCTIGLNLAWTLEVRGDRAKQAGDLQRARAWWEQGRQLLMGLTCAAEMPTSGAGASESTASSSGQQNKQNGQETEGQSGSPSGTPKEQQKQTAPSGTPKEQQEQTGKRLADKSAENSQANPDSAQKKQSQDASTKQAQLQKKQDAARKAAAQERQDSDGVSGSGAQPGDEELGKTW